MSRCDDPAYTPSVRERKVAYIDEQERRLTAYLKQMDEQDETEQRPVISLPREAARKKLKTLGKRAEKYRGESFPKKIDTKEREKTK